MNRYPNLIINQPRQSQSPVTELPIFEIKLFNDPARNHRMARPVLPCDVFCEAWEGFIYFNIRGEMVYNGALSRNLSTTWYDFTPPGRGKWYEKIFIAFDFHILP